MEDRLNCGILQYISSSFSLTSALRANFISHFLPPFLLHFPISPLLFSQFCSAFVVLKTHYPSSQKASCGPSEVSTHDRSGTGSSYELNIWSITTPPLPTIKKCQLLNPGSSPCFPVELPDVPSLRLISHCTCS